MTRPGAPLTSLFGRAVNQAIATAPGRDDTETRILDAAYVVLARRGTKAATMDDVAAEAGISRATLFRRYAGKDQLFEKVLAREIGAFLAHLAQRFETVTDPTEQVVVAFDACLQLRDHPLLRGADDAPGSFVRALGQGDPSPIALSQYAVRSNLAQAQAAGKLPPGDPDLQADALIHMILGYLAVPSAAVDLTDPAAVERLARSAIAPILTGPKVQRA